MMLKHFVARGVSHDDSCLSEAYRILDNIRSKLTALLMMNYMAKRTPSTLNLKNDNTRYSYTTFL